MANNFLVNGANLDNLLVPKNAIWQPGDRYTLWGWGNNTYGALGLGDTTHRSSPVQVGTLNTWSKVVCGSYSASAIKTDGTLWSWGFNNPGQLGLGDLISRSSPVQVGTLNTWSSVACGQYQTAAIKTDGTLWTWGSNTDGQLGLGDITHRSSPVQVGSLTNWSSVSCGPSYQNQTAAIKTDGTLWIWGYNAYGELGLGDITHRSSPVQVGSLTNWSLVACGENTSEAIKTDGTLWSWGLNATGQLGLGDTTWRSSPVQVGSLNNWAKIAGHYNKQSSAIKTNGTLWTWGFNAYGELGLGDLISRSSPVQVGSLNTWSSVSCGPYHTAAIKTDGTLWSWGGNNDGQLGLGDITHRSSPVQVGSLTNWSNIDCKSRILAIQSL